MIVVFVETSGGQASEVSLEAVTFARSLAAAGGGIPVDALVVGPMGDGVPKELAERHYADLSSKPFFPSLIEYITSGPVVAIALEGKAVVEQARKIIGATNPLAADPGSIRGQYCIDIGRNIIHGSDTVENAQKELALWFSEGLVDNVPVLHNQIYE